MTKPISILCLLFACVGAYAADWNVPADGALQTVISGVRAASITQIRGAVE